MIVPRGPSLANCSAAIAAAVVADIVAREQREEEFRRLRDEAHRAVMRRALSVAWVEPPSADDPGDPRASR
jgi:hypothetical protein